MKGATVYHQIKTLREQYSQRECARRLGISINTVRKYERMEMSEAAGYIGEVKRQSQFDVARKFIEEQLSNFPEMSAVKLLRQVKARHPQLSGKVRSLRNYIAPLRQAAAEGKIRHYAPVLDMEPGAQVQVDIGEDNVARDETGSSLKVYFVSFVFSYSRHGYASFHGRCYDTESFIRAHLDAFEYFGGIAAEYVYDQTKLVVINEKYREVFFNERFHQFAMKYGFNVRVCEGYDPESKGKVERFIQYVKSDFLYGEYFADIEAVKTGSLTWLDEVANRRIHAVTGRAPCEMFEEERPHLRGFEALDKERDFRWADKTGLISCEGNKYSVPYEYQRKQVWIKLCEGCLLIRHPQTGEEIARHPLSEEKGRIFKNNNHYRDYRKRVEELSEEAFTALKFLDQAPELIKRIKCDNPQIARDQLRALLKFGRFYEKEIWLAAIETILALPILKASVIESLLSTYKDRQRIAAIETQTAAFENAAASPLDRSLDQYMEVLPHA